MFYILLIILIIIGVSFFRVIPEMVANSSSPVAGLLSGVGLVCASVCGFPLLFGIVLFILFKLLSAAVGIPLQPVPVGALDGFWSFAVKLIFGFFIGLSMLGLGNFLNNKN